jgi:rhamnulokinase
VDFNGARFNFKVAHRFTTTTSIQSGLRWDVEDLTNQVFDGMGKLGLEGVPIASVGVDSWGIDYVLLDGENHLVDQPYSYRDPRNNAAFQVALDEFGAEFLYDASGIQLIAINTIFGLLSDARTNPQRLETSSRLLLIADYLHHLLSGSDVSERTLASTTGLLDARRGLWSDQLISALGLPRHLFPELVDPGTELGPLLDFGLSGWSGAKVVMPGSHDTASAALAVPFEDGYSNTSAFISSGSWSLIGRERPLPSVTEDARLAQLTNEVGFGSNTLVLKNVTGMWLLQASRRQWEVEGSPLSYADIALLAEAEQPLVSIIDPDAPEFVVPGDMPARIREFCRRTGQPIPDTIGKVARTIVDSLALRYRSTLDSLADVTGIPIDAVHVVGGGSQHNGLAQATADATRLPVYRGPVEATALGNAGGQLIALGELAGMSDLRSVVRASDPIITTEPGAIDLWDRAGERFLEITNDQTQTTRTQA